MWYEIVAILLGIAIFWSFNATRCTDGFMSYFESFKDEIVKLDAIPTGRLVGKLMATMFYHVGVLVTALALDWLAFAVLSMVWALFYWLRLFVAYHLQVTEAC